jgi:hypothetical protein
MADTIVSLIDNVPKGIPFFEKWSKAATAIKSLWTLTSFLAVGPISQLSLLIALTWMVLDFFDIIESELDNRFVGWFADRYKSVLPTWIFVALNKLSTGELRRAKNILSANIKKENGELKFDKKKAIEELNKLPAKKLDQGAVKKPKDILDTVRDQTIITRKPTMTGPLLNVQRGVPLEQKFVRPTARNPRSKPKRSKPTTGKKKTTTKRRKTKRTKRVGKARRVKRKTVKKNK